MAPLKRYASGKLSSACIMLLLHIYCSILRCYSIVVDALVFDPVHIFHAFALVLIVVTTLIIHKYCMLI